jgi:hypothetical protein
MQPNGDLSSTPRPWGRVSTMRLETFSDGVFAIAVTMMGVLGGLLVAQVAVSDALFLVWLLLLVVGGRSAVRVVGPPPAPLRRMRVARAVVFDRSNRVRPVRGRRAPGRASASPRRSPARRRTP